MRQERDESAGERTIALYKSDQQQQLICVCGMHHRTKLMDCSDWFSKTFSLCTLGLSKRWFALVYTKKTGTAINRVWSLKYYLCDDECAYIPIDCKNVRPCVCVVCVRTCVRESLYACSKIDVVYVEFVQNPFQCTQYIKIATGDKTKICK